MILENFSFLKNRISFLVFISKLYQKNFCNGKQLIMYKKFEENEFSLENTNSSNQILSQNSKKFWKTFKKPNKIVIEQIF